jgi:hypothetical protein
MAYFYFPVLDYIMIYFNSYFIIGTRSSVVEVLRYKPEGRELDSLSGHWIFQLT